MQLTAARSNSSVPPRMVNIPILVRHINAWIGFSKNLAKGNADDWFYPPFGGWPARKSRRVDVPCAIGWTDICHLTTGNDLECGYICLGLIVVGETKAERAARLLTLRSEGLAIGWRYLQVKRDHGNWGRLIANRRGRNCLLPDNSAPRTLPANTGHFCCGADYVQRNTAFRIEAGDSRSSVRSQVIRTPILTLIRNLPCPPLAGVRSPDARYRSGSPRRCVLPIPYRFAGR